METKKREAKVSNDAIVLTFEILFFEKNVINKQQPVLTSHYITYINIYTDVIKTSLMYTIQNIHVD